MKVVFIILVVLFAALFVIVPLVEKYGKRHSPEELGKISRYAMALIALILVLQLILFMFK